MGLSLWELKYIVEVAKTGSISKASQNLFLSQPHLSNTIKTVEKDLGINLFLRSSKGMELTEEGKQFVRQSQSILSQVATLESTFYMKPEETLRVSISVTRSYQVNRRVIDFINRHADKKLFVLHVKETNPFQVLEDVRLREAEFGALHCFDAQIEYFINNFRTYGINYQKHYEREFLLAMSQDNPLAFEPHITKDMIKDQTVVIYGDYEISEASYQVITEVSDIVLTYKRVYVYDRAAAMETLSCCNKTFMWITGLHPDTLKQYGLVLRRCEDVHVKDIGFSIYPSSEELSSLSEELLKELQDIDWTEDIKDI